MKINELIRQLTEIKKDWGDIEVRVAYQKNYPLAGTVANLWVQEETDTDDYSAPQKLWIAVDNIPSHSTESPYAFKEAWQR